MIARTTYIDALLSFFEMLRGGFGIGQRVYERITRTWSGIRRNGKQCLQSGIALGALHNVTLTGILLTHCWKLTTLTEINLESY